MKPQLNAGFMKTLWDPVAVALRAKLGAENVLTGLTERLARGHDASIYRLIPRLVVRPRDVVDVQTLFEICRDNGTSVTFRAAGTSLSGQAVTDGILAELTHWRQSCVSADGTLITSQPGVTGGHLNALLARYRRRIGPDPASLAASMIGGIVANNASGMCCGTHSNSYKTLAGLKLVLADGYVLDTGAKNADETLKRERPQLHQGLLALRNQILDNPELAAKIRKKYAIKNTMGYSLNSYVDFERAVDILAHLLVGSEGTLGFIAEVTLRTVVESAQQATALAYFTELTQAGSAVELLAAAGATVLEILDHRSMAALQTEMKYPFALTSHCAALLIEIHEDDAAAFNSKLTAASEILSRQSLLAPVAFTQDPTLRAHYWKLRKGLFPKIGGERRPGTAVIIEDICLPRNRLAESINDLHTLFQAHGFPEAVIFGHAKDGNLHFVLCHDFSQRAAIAQYAAMMEALAQLVVERYDGSLKAEHGTGRNMAPFVKYEWGAALYEIMRATKALLDPSGILNPGVLLTDDPEAHLKNLKPLPPVAARVDACIECGFCERVCPSRDLSLTPRQRIAVQRELSLLDRKSARQVRKEYAYLGVKTCAGDGLCSTVCPVGIDTGAYMRDLKAHDHSKVAHGVALQLTKHLTFLSTMARWGLRILNLLRFPKFPKAAYRGRSPRLASSNRPQVVCFSACLSKVMDNENAPTKALAAFGFEVIPAAAQTACCGQAFQSKGYPAAARVAAENSIDLLWKSSDGGRLAIICDTSPCTARLVSLRDELSSDFRERWEKLQIFDFHSFVAQRVLGQKKSWPKLPRHLVLHPTCSSTKQDTVSDLVAVARAFASEVTVPISAGCCGFAGDKGFEVPELTESATRAEAHEVRALQAKEVALGKEVVGYSTCQTCALGMSNATGLPYQSIAQLCWDALQSGVPEAVEIG